MSIRSAALSALESDARREKMSWRGGESDEDALDFFHQLERYVPTEILFGYVIIAVTFDRPDSSVILSWAILALFVFLSAGAVYAETVAARRVRHQHHASRPVPVYEMVASGVSFLAWASALTGSPFASWSVWQAHYGVAAVVSVALGLLICDKVRSGAA